MTRSLDALYHRFVVGAFDKQMRLANFLAASLGPDAVQWYFPPGQPVPGNIHRDAFGLGTLYAWEPQTGTLYFDGGIRFSAQLLGLQAWDPDIWLWSWFNTPLQLPAVITTVSLRMRDYGSSHGIAEFREGALPANELFSDDLQGIGGHGLAAIALGVLGYDAYYSAPVDGGTAFVLLKDQRLKDENRDPFSKVLATFPQSLRAFPVSDHKAALSGYLEQCGFRPEVCANAIRASLDGSEVIDAEFDGGRLLKLIATVDGRSRTMVEQ